MSFIEFRSVTKTYERRPALSNFTLHVEQGERLVILGPSGCGKTTVLRLLAGLAIPDEGAITVADSVVAANGRILLEPEKRNIGMVFQDLALWPHLTVEGNLEFGLNARSEFPKPLARNESTAYSGSPTWRTAVKPALPSFPVVSSSVSLSLGRWCWSR